MSPTPSILPITIDGSDGGGQILRSSLTLSMITGQPFHITHIRGRRSNPGLRRQHLTCVTAAATMCGAIVQRAEMGSTELTFTPGAIQSGTHHIDIGTAGSTVLVAQTLLPALWNVGKPSTLHITGGTHNRNAPTADYFQSVYLSTIQRLGIDANMELVRHGFEPKGGGHITIKTAGVWTHQYANFLERGDWQKRTITVKLSQLEDAIAQREIEAAAEVLGWSMADESTIIPITDAIGSGNSLAIQAEFDGIKEQSIGIGVRGISAEQVGRNAAIAMVQYLESGAVVGLRLADQLQLPFALMGMGQFLMPPPTNHFKTNARVIEAFTGVRFVVEPQTNNAALVNVICE